MLDTLGGANGLGSTMKGGNTTQHKIENLLELIRSNQSKIIQMTATTGTSPQPQQAFDTLVGNDTLVASKNFHQELTKYATANQTTTLT